MIRTSKISRLWLLSAIFALSFGTNSQSEAKTANDFVFDFKRLGYLTSLNCSAHKAMVNPTYWHTFDYQAKEDSTAAIASYCKDHGGKVAIIHILNKMDGKELGGINFMGFYVK